MRACLSAGPSAKGIVIHLMAAQQGFEPRPKAPKASFWIQKPRLPRAIRPGKSRSRHQRRVLLSPRFGATMGVCQAAENRSEFNDLRNEGSPSQTVPWPCDRVRGVRTRSSVPPQLAEMRTPVLRSSVKQARLERGEEAVERLARSLEPGPLYCSHHQPKRVCEDALECGDTEDARP